MFKSPKKTSTTQRMDGNDDDVLYEVEFEKKKKMKKTKMKKPLGEILIRFIKLFKLSNQVIFPLV